MQIKKNDNKTLVERSIKALQEIQILLLITSFSISLSVVLGVYLLSKIFPVSLYFLTVIVIFSLFILIVEVFTELIRSYISLHSLSTSFFLQGIPQRIEVVIDSLLPPKVKMKISKRKNSTSKKKEESQSSLKGVIFYTIILGVLFVILFILPFSLLYINQSYKFTTFLQKYDYLLFLTVIFLLGILNSQRAKAFLAVYKEINYSPLSMKRSFLVRLEEYKQRLVGTLPVATLLLLSTIFALFLYIPLLNAPSPFKITLHSPNRNVPVAQVGCAPETYPFQKIITSDSYIICYIKKINETILREEKKSNLTLHLKAYPSEKILHPERKEEGEYLFYIPSETKKLRLTLHYLNNSLPVTKTLAIFRVPRNEDLLQSQKEIAAAILAILGFSITLYNFLAHKR